MAIAALGNVGFRLAEHIIERFKLRSKVTDDTKRRLLVFDRNKAVLDKFTITGSVVRARSMAELFQQAEIIFGCVGCDLTAGILADLDAIADGKTRYLVSCSSFDVEFASLLKKARLTPGLCPFDLARYTNPKGSTFLIPQAGFPITFDRKPCSAPTEQMQMTRGLLLAGLLQAARLTKTTRPAQGVVPLDTHSQITVVKAWRDAKARDESWFGQYWLREEEEIEAVARESQRAAASLRP
jgi:hypothetical protein